LARGRQMRGWDRAATPASPSGGSTVSSFEASAGHRAKASVLDRRDRERRWSFSKRLRCGEQPGSSVGLVERPRSSQRIGPARSLSKGGPLLVIAAPTASRFEVGTHGGRKRSGDDTAATRRPLRTVRRAVHAGALRGAAGRVARASRSKVARLAGCSVENLVEGMDRERIVFSDLARRGRRPKRRRCPARGR